MNIPTETYVRALRDRIYSHPDPEHGNNCSEKNWQACREHWMEPDQVKWLEEQVKKHIGSEMWRGE